MPSPGDLALGPDPRGRAAKKLHTFGLQNLNDMTHVTLGERYERSILNEQGGSTAEKAKALGRSTSTIGRELKRNADGRNGRYRPELAQRKAESRNAEKNRHGAFTPGIR